MDISPIRVVRAQCCARIPQLRWCARNRRHILQQRCQGGEHRKVNIGSGANTPGRAGRPIEHPGRNLQPSPGCPTREAATENLSARLLNHLMNMDQASCPRMPRIKKLVLRDPVGVASSTTTPELKFSVHTGGRNRPGGGAGTHPALPLLWRPHVRHRDLRCRLPTTLPADGNEDRYLMRETATFRTRTAKGFPRWSTTRYAAARPNTWRAFHSAPRASPKRIVNAQSKPISQTGG